MTPKIDIWKPVDYDKKRKVSTGRNECIELIKATASAKEFNTLVISGDLVDEACWSAGDRVTLFKAGEELFMLKPQPAGLETLRSRGGRQLCINSVSLVRTAFGLFAIKGITKFDAWVDGDSIIFKPCKEDK